MKRKIFLVIIPLLLFFLIPTDVFASGSYNLDGACLTSNFNNTCNNFTTTYWDFAYNGVQNTLNIIQVYPYQSFSINKGDRVFVSFTLNDIDVSTGETNVWTINDPIPYGETNTYFNLIDSRVLVLSDWYSEKDGYGTDNAGSYNGRLFTIILEAKQSTTIYALNFRLNGILGYYHGVAGLKFRGFVYYGDMDYQTELLYMLVNQNSSIVSAQQGTTNAINSVNSTLNDDSTTSSQSSTSSFFNNFSVNNHGLTGVVLAPVNFIQSFTNTCQPVTLTLFNKDIPLPCGDTIFWGKADSRISNFRNIWNVLVGGPIIYALLLSIYRSIHKAMDPDKNEEGGLDL